MDVGDETISSPSKDRIITDLVLYKHIVTTAHYNFWCQKWDIFKLLCQIK